ncbi:glycosyl hydrolases family 15 [Halalkalicoccus paucihalophilus]|uniref:Glycosyl hydrolases family 15 n=1 Tax=Halalkalicoccus paucihalophilus TaxID=1008153 RepID=A0A151A8C3_9EURY|nr:glycoside hydrolase family 15 protein [Halalkalicoccus paucihalophilus]KYH23946.1 glycosyl hydrolases family 15 [Halalkalicoccus paucihalophilus]
MTSRDSNRVQSNDEGYKPLEEYGIIGNLETVALVGSDGAIDWCCFPHVESSSIFARILDDQRGGHFTVQPTRSFEAVQEYVDRTNVLQTRFQTVSGQATVTDFMPVPPLAREDQTPMETIFRRVTCEHGQVELRVDFTPRFEYARTTPTFESIQEGAIARGDEEFTVLSSSVPLSVSAQSAGTTVTLEEGDTHWFVLGYGHEPPLESDDHQGILDDVVDYWRDWVHTCSDGDECSVGGPWHRDVVRSALVLKLLINHETGAICAAPTTSLPEDIGGVRNWDYRYNWIRDAAFTVRALTELGHVEEAKDYFDLCLTHCSRGPPSDVNPVYSVYGDPVPDERTLDHLSGYRGSAPVRVGNAAADQHQVDVYGELIHGIYETTRYGKTVDEDDWTAMYDLIDYVCEAWEEPDAGIWEMRTDRQQFVYSKMMCWVALDRGLKIAAETDFDAPTDRWETCRREIKETVLEKGYSETAESFVSAFGDEDRLDATSLLIPLVGFLPADDSRVQSTIDAILDRLLVDGGLVMRYEGDDGLPGEEGAFLLCSFWLVSALAQSGRVDEAEAIFEDTRQHVSPLGLLSEEVDSEEGIQLGNVPQAFSHIGLINGALALSTESDSGLNPDEADAKPPAENGARRDTQGSAASDCTTRSQAGSETQ